MYSEYKILVDIINKNLENNGCEKIIFEQEENLYENIYDFPIQSLISIESDTYFITELFYKALNRPIDTQTFNNYMNKLKTKKTNRMDLIDNVISSQEYKNKKTFLRFKEESK